MNINYSVLAILLFGIPLYPGADVYSMPDGSHWELHFDEATKTVSCDKFATLI